MMKMEFKMTFTTHAFIGDAERKGAMRSPPLKSLIRHFWRIEKAGPDYDHTRLLREEGVLFGSAADKAASRSLVRLKLEAWKAKTIDEGTLPQTGQVFHKEAQGGRKIEAALYLGYGPVGTNSRLQCERPLAPGKDGGTKLFIAFPEKERETLLNTLKLVQAFGTIGGRSRNGWGSICLEGENLPDAWAILKQSDFIRKRARPVKQCLLTDWPHAIGLDASGKPLIWKTKQARPSWTEVIKDLAEIKIAFRTHIAFKRPKGKLDDRHILAYPVTNHPVNEWGKEARLPNQLRFKVIENGENRFLGLAFHIPCKTPDDIGTEKSTTDEQMQIWTRVHKKIDELMERVG